MNYCFDGMDGHLFEAFCAEILRYNGFYNVSVTKGSGDQGVDILAEKAGIQYAIQCKNYSSALSNRSIQEVTAGKALYNCHVGAVMTNSTFTPSALQLAEATSTLLWDREVVYRMMSVVPEHIVRKYCGDTTNGWEQYFQRSVFEDNYVDCSDVVSGVQPLRKGMKTWMIIFSVLSVLYLLMSASNPVIFPVAIICVVFTGMFFALAKSSKEAQYIFDYPKGIKKTVFVWLCLGVAFIIFSMLAVSEINMEEGQTRWQGAMQTEQTMRSSEMFVGESPQQSLVLRFIERLLGPDTNINVSDDVEEEGEWINNNEKRR